MIPIGFFSQTNFGSLGSYWMGLLSAGTAKSLFIQNVGVDSSNDVFISGYSNVNDDADCHIARFNSSGVLQSQRILSGTGSQNFSDIVVSSVGQVIGVGYDSSASPQRGIITKYDGAPNNALLLQKTLVPSGTLVYANGIALDTLSTSMYMVGQSADGAILVKYNSSLGIVWQKVLSTTLQNPKVVVDSSGKVYFAGTSGSSILTTTVVKTSSDGVIEWQKTIGDGASSFAFSDIAVDSSSNVVIGAYVANSTSFVAKLNSSLVLQWSHSFPSTNLRGVKTDSSGNIYIAGSEGASGARAATITKITSAGDLTFHRKFSISGIPFYMYDIAFNSSGHMNVAGSVYISGGYMGFVAKLPSDGSLTGTYLVGSNILTYLDSSLNYTNISNTVSTSSYAFSTATNTDTSSSYTDSAGSLTFTKTT